MRYEILHLRAKSLFNPFLCMIPIMTWNICMEKGPSTKFQLEISQNKIRNSPRRQSRTPSSYSKPYLEGQVNQLYKQINSQFNTGYFVYSDDIEQEISKAGFKILVALD